MQHIPTHPANPLARQVLNKQLGTSAARYANTNHADPIASINRAALSGDAQIAPLMAADLVDIMQARGIGATVDVADMKARGWTLAQIVEYHPAALERVRRDHPELAGECDQ